MLALAALGGALALLSAGCGNSGAADHAVGMMQVGPGMMGYAPEGGGQPISSLQAALRQADRFGEALDLHAGEVMQFSNGFYAELLDARGVRATAVLIDPGSGWVWIEYGPAMMWNTRYGMMSGFSLPRGNGMTVGEGMMGPGATMAPGMMGGSSMSMGGPRRGHGWGMMGGRYRGDPTWMPYGGGAQSRKLRARSAERIAARWLAVNATGLAAGEAEAFPGYYTLHTLRDGKVVGMLSVNAHTGAVWYHWWHGRFVGMTE